MFFTSLFLSVLSTFRLCVVRPLPFRSASFSDRLSFRMMTRRKKTPLDQKHQPPSGGDNSQWERQRRKKDGRIQQHRFYARERELGSKITNFIIIIFILNSKMHFYSAEDEVYKKDGQLMETRKLALPFYSFYNTWILLDRYQIYLKIKLEILELY